MSTDFTPVVTAVRSWFRLGSGLSMIVLENEARPYVNQQWGEIKLVGTQIDQTDSVAYDDDRKPYVRCARMLTFRLAVESFSQTPSLFAPVHLEQLRARTNLPRLMDVLKAVPLAVASFTETRNADRIVDERFISRFEMDVRIRWGFTVAAPADEPALEVIDKVTGKGTIDPDAKEAPYSAERP